MGRNDLAAEAYFYNYIMNFLIQVRFDVQMKFRCIEVTLNYFENSLSHMPSLIPICYCNDLLSWLVSDTLFKLLFTLITSHNPF